MHSSSRQFTATAHSNASTFSSQEIHPPTLLLIDAGLPDLLVLLAGVGAGVRPVLVGRDEDALDIVQREMQAAAPTAGGAPARLAIVAHGAAGAVLIGREPIERASLEARAAAWAAIKP